MSRRLYGMRMLPVVIALALGLGCGRLTVDDGRAGVVGRIVDRDGAAVAGVRVMLIRDRRPVAETSSGADGRFELQGSPGPASVFGLLDSTADQGVWRAGLDLLPTGQTDVGALELETVWAHPEVLWLRGAGFDEQLTRPEDHLSYLWGGGAGEPLLATHQWPDALDVFRVDDDGTPHLLTAQPWVDPYSIAPPDAGSPWPPIVTVSAGRDQSGRVLVLVVHGGYTWVSSQGTQAMPVQRLTWLDVATGATVLDVQVPDTATVSWELSRGALVTDDRSSTFASVKLGRAVPLSSRVSGRLFPTSAGAAVARFDAAGVIVARIDDDGQVTSGAPLSVSAVGVGGAVIGDVDVELAMDWATGQLSVVRLDGVTLEASVEQRPLGGEPYTHGWTWLQPCDPARPTYALLESSDQGARLTRVGGSTSTQTVLASPDWPTNLSVACVTPDGFWGVGQRRSDGVRAAVRATPGQVVVTPLDAGVSSVSRVGPWPLFVKRENGVPGYRLGSRDGSLDPSFPLARVPFVTAPAGLSSGGETLLMQALMGAEATAIVRVRPPAEAAP